MRDNPGFWNLCAIAEAQFVLGFDESGHFKIII